MAVFKRIENVYYRQVLGTSIVEYLVPAGLGRENWHPEQYLKPNTTYNTGRNGIAYPEHIL